MGSEYTDQSRRFLSINKKASVFQIEHGRPSKRQAPTLPLRNFSTTKLEIVKRNHMPIASHAAPLLSYNQPGPKENKASDLIVLRGFEKYKPKEVYMEKMRSSGISSGFKKMESGNTFGSRKLTFGSENESDLYNQVNEIGNTKDGSKNQKKVVDDFEVLDNREDNRKSFNLLSNLISVSSKFIKSNRKALMEVETEQYQDEFMNKFDLRKKDTIFKLNADMS